MSWEPRDVLSASSNVRSGPETSSSRKTTFENDVRVNMFNPD